MPTVAITDWRPGFQKVSCTSLLREHAGLGLAEAKRVTDGVLDGHEQIVHVQSTEAALALVAALEIIGASARIASAV